MLFDQYSPNLLFALACLGASFFIRWLRTGRFLARTGAELPLALFWASAVLSTWAAYDRQLALLQLARFFGTTVAFYAVIDSGANMRRLVVYAMVVATAFLGAYFMLHYDFSAGAVKFAPLTALGRWLNTNLPAVPGPTVHPNVAAGTLILGIPLAIALLVETWRQKRWLLVAFLGAITLIAGSGLLLTTSRGAWLALGGTCILAFLVWVQRRWLAKRKAVLAFWLSLAAVAVVTVAALAQSGILDRLLGQIPDPTGTLRGRTVLWQQSALLVRDYPLTGIGLHSFPMVFSTYTLLIHVPYLDHAHNTYLQVLIEQGWLGFAALLGFGLAGLWWVESLLRRKHVSSLAWGGLAALTAGILQGLVDVTLYLERTLPLVGIVAGLLAAEYLLAPTNAVPVKKSRSRKMSLLLQEIASLFHAATKHEKGIYTGAVLVILALGVIFWKPLASSLQSNLGAVVQTGLELRTYSPEHFDRPTLDEVRRSVDLSRAQVSFQEALALADNLTAVQRLVEIALSRGQYSSALDLIQSSWQSGARDQVTRMLYGDALVANGQPDSAVQVIRGLSWAQGRIKSQAFYRYDRQGDYRREVDAWKAATLLDPADVQAAEGLAGALKKLNP